MNDNDRLIRCVDVGSGANILEFPALKGRAQATYASYDISVQSIGDDISEVIIAHQLTKNFVKSNRSEQMLTVTVGNGSNSSVRTIVQSLTHKGFAQASVADVTTGDQAEVQSHSRRGVNWMRLRFVPSNSSLSSITINCEKI